MGIARSDSARWRLGTIAAALGLAALAAPLTEAHKAITSPYNFNDHVFPILRDRCGRCHFEGGPTPMSLLSYNDALPWAESMREQLVGERMPAWYADAAGPAVRGGHLISPRELDIIVTWATGGTPQGDLAKKPAPVPPPPEWRAGKPDLVVSMAEDYTVPAGTMEDSHEFTLATDVAETRWVRAVDVLPGAKSMVREATVRVENGPVLAVWVPGHEATPAPSGAAFRLPAAARLKLLVRYRKHYLDEQNAVKDRTSVGLYLTDEPVSGKSIDAFAVDGKVGDEGSSEAQTFSGTPLASGARVLALRPQVDQAYATIDVRAVLANGRKVPLLLLRGQRPEWPRRYWLSEPVELPKGARVEVVAMPVPPSADDLPSPRRAKLQVALDFVAQ